MILFSSVGQVESREEFPGAAQTIVTRCIESGFELLHSDRDFGPFAKHLGLRVV
jgi:hypothetical protein